MSGIKKIESKKESKEEYKEQKKEEYKFVSPSSKHIENLIIWSKAHMKLTKDRSGCQTAHAERSKAADLLAITNVEDVDTCCCTVCNKQSSKQSSKQSAKMIGLVPIYRFAAIEGAGDHGGNGGIYPCDKCRKPTGQVYFGLPGGLVSWSCKARCADCCTKGPNGVDGTVNFRINGLSRCQVCHTDSISIRGTQSGGKYSCDYLGWEAFTCKCETMRHIIYNGETIMYDKFGVQPGTNKFYSFHSESRYTPEKCVKLIRSESSTPAPMQSTERPIYYPRTYYASDDESSQDDYSDDDYYYG